MYLPYCMVSVKLNDLFNNLVKVFKHSCKKILPGQGIFSELDPTHGAPPFLGVGLSQYLFLYPSGT